MFTSTLLLRSFGAQPLAATLGVAAVLSVQAASPAGDAPLAIDTAVISIAGTSNIHAYTASTTAVRVTEARLAVPAPAGWDDLLRPGAIEAFAVAIPAATLSSPKEGLDKNMHKALKVTAHPEITFTLRRLEQGAAGALHARGMLQIAGVEREVTLRLRTERKGDHLVVKGELALLMTDYGISPPKAMLGMLKTDPKVTVTFETVLGVPLT